MLFPGDGLVYDYQLQDGGVSNKHYGLHDQDDDEERKIEVSDYTPINL